jgi:superoxide dismutase, Cu-Zn family
MRYPSLCLALGAMVLSACATTDPTAAAALAPTRGNTTMGTVRFLQQGDVVQVSGEVSGLRPNAEHGFHVHEKGDCSGDGVGAGGHYNPGGQPHGRHAGGMHHAGDLPSLRADGTGVARFSFYSRSISIEGGMADIIGKALIVHRDPDDYTTQPSGNAGARLACAVIRRG